MRLLGFIAALAWASCTFPDVTILEGETTASSSSSAGGTASSVATGGGPSSASSGGACVPEDGDGDGQEGCGGPDCNDDNGDVFLGQSMYFDVPIPGTSSFDYDCSNDVDFDPDQIFAGCGLNNVCSGEGYDPMRAQCGTVNSWVTCVALPTCHQELQSGREALRCH